MSTNTRTTARASILAAVRASSPPETPLPLVPPPEGDASVEKFAALLEGIGGRLLLLSDVAELTALVARLHPAAHRLASALLPATVAVDALTPVETLAAVEVAVLRGELGVAENGAVWLPEGAMLHRALPIITQHLVLVLDRRHIVATMHQAYARLPTVGGYGVFVAGPSKTADIEQSLVIGAHGARSLTVLLH